MAVKQAQSCSEPLERRCQGRLASLGGRAESRRGRRNGSPSPRDRAPPRRARRAWSPGELQGSQALRSPRIGSNSGPETSFSMLGAPKTTEILLEEAPLCPQRHLLKGAAGQKSLASGPAASAAPRPQLAPPSTGSSHTASCR